MLTTRKSLLVLSIITLLPNLAFAELSYGLGIGHISSEKTKESDVFALLRGSRNNDLDNFSQDNTDIAFRLFASFDYENFLDIEFAYTDYGENSFSGDKLFPNVSNTTRDYSKAEASGELTGFSLSIGPKKQYPNGLIVSGKVGALMWSVNGEGYKRNEITFTDSSTSSFEETLDIDDDGVSFLLGIGLSYSNFTLGFERVSINSSETNLIMLSAKF
tara:strand:- start:584 stop:1234 length:651 start_codon:yes stop_codon:yes gene_type:complete